MGSLGGSGGGFELNLNGLKRDELDSVLAMVAYPSRVCNNGPSLFLLSSIHQTVFPFSSFLSPKADFHCCFRCGSVVQPQVLSWDSRGRVINAPQVFPHHHQKVINGSHDIRSRTTNNLRARATTLVGIVVIILQEFKYRGFSLNFQPLPLKLCVYLTL